MRLRPLRSGQYLLRYALFRNDFESSKDSRIILSTGEQIVEVASGKLITDIELHIKDRRVINSRNSLAVELSALDLNNREFRNSGLLRQAYEAPLEPNGSSRLVFSPVNYDKLNRSLKGKGLIVKDLKDVIATEKKLRHEEDEFDQVLQNHFAQVQNLIELGPEGKLFSKLSPQRLETGEIDSETYRALCEHWQTQILPDLAAEYSGSNQVSPSASGFVYSCTASRKQGLSQYAWFRKVGLGSIGLGYEPFFVFQKIYQVEKAKVREQRPPGRNFFIQIGDRFYVRSRREYNYEAGLRPLSWIPIVGPYLSLAGMLAVDVSVKEDQGNELRFAANMQVNVEENTLAVDFEKYRRCLIVRMNPAKLKAPIINPYLNNVSNPIRRDQLKRAMQERGFLVCDPAQETPVTKTEKFYYLSTGREVGAQQDPADLRNKQIALPLRSERDFMTFMEAGRSTLSHPDSVNSQSGSTSVWAPEVEKAFLSLPPASPGLYVDSVFF